MAFRFLLPLVMVGAFLAPAAHAASQADATKSQVSVDFRIIIPVPPLRMDTGLGCIASKQSWKIGKMLRKCACLQEHMEAGLDRYTLSLP